MIGEIFSGIRHRPGQSLFWAQEEERFIWNDSVDSSYTLETIHYISILTGKESIVGQDFFVSQACQDLTFKQVNLALLIRDETRSLSPSQHGFLPRRSCLSNLFLQDERVTRFLDEGHTVDLVYLDFAKAFDSVNHDKLTILTSWSLPASMEPCWIGLNRTC